MTNRTTAGIAEVSDLIADRLQGDFADFIWQGLNPDPGNAYGELCFTIEIDGKERGFAVCIRDIDPELMRQKAAQREAVS